MQSYTIFVNLTRLTNRKYPLTRNKGNGHVLYKKDMAV